MVRDASSPGSYEQTSISELTRAMGINPPSLYAAFGDIAGRVRRGQADGDVAATVDPEALAAYLRTVLSGMSARAREGAGRAELRATAELATAPLD